MPRSKKADFSSPDPLEILPPPRFSPLRRDPSSPHKQLQLRLLELNADIGHDKELTPGRNNRNSFSFIDGSVNGRELFVTTRKPAAKRGRTKVKDITGDTPKRGRTRKRPDTNTPSGTPRTPKRKSPAKKPQLPVDDGVRADDVRVNENMEEPEIVDVNDGTETSQADMMEEQAEETQDLSETEQETQAYSEPELEDSGLPDLPDYDLETPTSMRSTRIMTPRDGDETTPLPVQPYRSFHSSPPSSPVVYEEYQVPIPTSSSPAKPSSKGPSSPSTLYTRTPIPTAVSRDVVHDRIRRRARSRSASRERRMSIVLTPWQGLPSTPRKTSEQSLVGHEFSKQRLEGSVSEESALSTRSTETREQLRPPRNQVVEVRQTTYTMESMTPVRKWAAEIAEGAFQFDKSPSKIIQLPIQSRLPSHTSQHHPQILGRTEQDEEKEEELYGEFSRDDEVIVNISDLEDEIPPPSSATKTLPQLARLRENSGRGNSPIVITSSPPEQLTKQVHYQWKTIIPHTPTPAVLSSVAPTPEPSRPSTPVADAPLQESTTPESPSEPDISRNDFENTPTPHHSLFNALTQPPSFPEIDTLSLSQCRISSRHSSPARSIISQLGDDVVDISSKSPLAAKRAAKILLRSQYFEKIDFDDDNEGRKIWDEVSANKGDYDLSKASLSDNDDESEQYSREEDEIDEDEEEEEEEQMVDSPSPVCPAPPPRISYGEWTKLDWKRLEKCLDHSKGELNDTINLFQERYVGREREELEMRLRAVLLARRRRELEGRKVEFILGTAE